MATPKITQAKIENAMSTWEHLAKTATFGKMTLAQFKTKVQPSLDARTMIKDLRDQLTEAYTERDAADRDSLATLQLLVNGVKGDADFGENSALYAALGYIRKANRKSGLRRVSPKTPPPA